MSRKSQLGATALIALAIIAGIVVLFAGVFMSTYNSYVTLEEGIVAADRSRQTTLSNLSQKVKETIGVKDMAVEDIRKTVTEQIKLRTGEGGYQNFVLMLKEHNIAPDPAMYAKIMNIIDSGRTEFLASERMLIDRKQTACVKVRRFPATLVLPVMGLPTLAIGCQGGKDDYPAILSDRAREMFQTGTDKGLF